MAITTYLSYTSKHEDKEIQLLLEELSEQTGILWCAEKVLRRKYWFKEDEYLTTLYKRLFPDQNDYQVFACVATDRELRCYLLGALGEVYRKIKEGR